jgi:hypothetical protein
MYCCFFSYVPVNADIVPGVETSVGYEGTSALGLCDVPIDIPTVERSCTQPLSGTYMYPFMYLTHPN